jgi:glutamate synthase (ferredoxin)
MQVPHKFMQKVAAAEGIELPAAGQYGVGAVYGSPDAATRSKSRHIFADVVAAEGLKVLDGECVGVGAFAV